MKPLRRILVTIARVAVIAWIAACAYLGVMQRSLVYPGAGAWTEDIPADIELRSDDETLRGWIANPGRERVLLYFGGNGERVAWSRDELAAMLPDVTTYLVAYRGYAGSTGSPSEAGLRSDAMALYDEVRRRHSDAPIAVLGRSLGSGVASDLAARRPVDRLVLVTPFDSLVETAASHFPVVPVRWLLRDRFDSVANLAGYEGPVLVLRAGRDVVVPPARTGRLVASLGARAQVVAFEDAGHDGISREHGYAEAIARFLEKSQVAGRAVR